MDGAIDKIFISHSMKDTKPVLRTRKQVVNSEVRRFLCAPVRFQVKGGSHVASSFARRWNWWERISRSASRFHLAEPQLEQPLSVNILETAPQHWRSLCAQAVSPSVGKSRSCGWTSARSLEQDYGKNVRRVKFSKDLLLMFEVCSFD